MDKKIIVVILISLFFLPSFSQSEQRSQKGLETSLFEKREEAVMAVFSEIEAAWQKGDVELLTKHLSNKRVYISFLKGGPRGSALTSLQAQYLLSDIFKYTLIEKFEFTKYKNIKGEEKRPVGIAERHYRLEKGGFLYHDQIVVTLEEEEGKWVVVEIKGGEEAKTP